VFEQLRTTAHTREEAQLVDRLSALIERGQGTPGAMDQFGTAVDTATTQIDEEVIPLITTGHSQTQQAITSAVEKVEETTGHAVDDKKVADDEDREWNECVAQEKQDRISVETAEEELEAAQGRVAQPCDAEKEAAKFSTEVKLASFSCDIEEQGGQCDTQTYKNTAQTMLDEAKKDQQDKNDEYDAAVALCQEAKDNVTTATDKRDAAIITWGKQQGLCLQRWGERESALCDFGTALQEKCAAVDAYRLLEEQVAGTDNEHSHEDRENEYATAQIAQCLIRGIAANPGSLDPEDLTACETQVRSIGALDWHQDRFDASMVTDQFTCSEDAIEFTGMFWTLPAAEEAAPQSDSYKQDSSGHVEAVDPRNSFSFCQGLGK